MHSTVVIDNRPLPEAFVGQTVSIDFDGSAESMGASTGLIGIGSLFTIACWAKITNVSSRQDTLWTIEEGASAPMRLFQRSNVGTAPSYQFFGGGNNVAWTSLPITSGEWHHVVLRGDGSLLKMFINGSDQGSAGFGSDTQGTFTDVTRRIEVMDASSGVPNGLGRVASLAIWDVVLTADEITAIYNSGSIAFDLNTDSGNYASSADLQHWFQLGRDSTDIGKDSGIGSPLFDLDDASVGITTDDIVTDAPA